MSGCAGGDKYFVHIPSAVTSQVPPDVARDLPPVMVLPLKELREMLLQKSEDEDCARQSGIVDRLRGSRPSMIQFEEMD